MYVCKAMTWRNAMTLNRKTHAKIFAALRAASLCYKTLNSKLSPELHPSTNHIIFPSTVIEFFCRAARGCFHSTVIAFFGRAARGQILTIQRSFSRISSGGNDEVPWHEYQLLTPLVNFTKCSCVKLNKPKDLLRKTFEKYKIITNNATKVKWNKIQIEIKINVYVEI